MHLLRHLAPIARETFEAAGIVAFLVACAICLAWILSPIGAQP